MPELPEVEQMRQILLPLVSRPEAQTPLTLTLLGESRPRSFITPDQVQAISGKTSCHDVIRKGKLLCLVLSSLVHHQQQQQQQQQQVKKNYDDETNHSYLYLHMGMTGEISSKDKAITWGSASEKSRSNDNNQQQQPKTFPPKYTHLLLAAGEYQVAFSDPRKFGSCLWQQTLQPILELAPDAMDTKDPLVIQNHILPALVGQPRGIKTILLEQKLKRGAVSGVGNWMADEVLYQCNMHPDQRYLSEAQADTLFRTLQAIAQTAIKRLEQDLDYPSEWLFSYRWTGKRSAVDFHGRTIHFLTSAGRTSAFVPLLQKLYKKTPADSRQLVAVKEEQNDGVEESQVVIPASISSSSSQPVAVEDIPPSADDMEQQISAAQSKRRKRVSNTDKVDSSSGAIESNQNTSVDRRKRSRAVTIQESNTEEKASVTEANKQTRRSPRRVVTP